MEWDEEQKRKVPVTVTNRFKVVKESLPSSRNENTLEAMNRTFQHGLPSVTSPSKNQQSGEFILNSGLANTGIEVKNPFIKKRNKEICTENFRLHSQIARMRASPQVCTVKRSKEYGKQMQYNDQISFFPRKDSTDAYKQKRLFSGFGLDA